MKLIAACDKNWAIGKDGRLLVSIPSDMKRFKEYTTGNVIVAGRKTVETFPGGQALPDRVNIILTKDPRYNLKGARIAHSLEEVQEMAKEYEGKDIYLVGGASVYEQMLELCDTAIITKIDYEYSADAFFPNLDENDEWEKVYESEEQTYFNIEYRFEEYRRKC